MPFSDVTFCNCTDPFLLSASPGKKSGCHAAIFGDLDILSLFGIEDQTIHLSLGNGYFGVVSSQEIFHQRDFHHRVSPSAIANMLIHTALRYH